MTTITRERLLKIQKWRETYGPGSNVVLPAEEAEELARIALASLEAEPVAWIVHSRGGDQLTTDANYVANAEGMGGIHSTPVYAAPPSPVVPVVDADDNFYSWFGREWHENYQHNQYTTAAKQMLGVMAESAWRAGCRTAMLQGAGGKPELTVWYGAMPETNGKTNWTAMLHRKGQHPWEGITIDCSEYPDRVRYEADRMRHLIGELADEPDILAYDADAHSGYVEPVSNRDELPEEKGASLQLRNLIRQRHAEWSDKTFGNVGPVGPLKHLSKEALEAAAEPDDLSEWADMQFLLWDAQRRAGICDGEITAAMEEKLKVNMARQWPEPKDGEPRLHIKEAGNSPVIPDSSEDTKRLNWLDVQNKRLNEYYGTSYGWKFDANFQRNAMMLNDSNYPVMTVRQAIDQAIASAPQQEVNRE